jgi:glycosyltransferase involved in cell wall biosynthesis
MFEDGRTARLVPAGDPAALADGIVAMVSNDEWRRTVVEAARERVRTFDVRAIAPRYLAHYEAMLGAESCL